MLPQSTGLELELLVTMLQLKSVSYLLTLLHGQLINILYPPPVASSVIGITATPNTDVPSNTTNYTIVCTIHPDSTVDECEVTVTSGAMIITSMCEYNSYSSYNNIMVPYKTKYWRE